MADREKKGFFTRLKNVFGIGKIDDEFFDELEETMITSDLGVMTTDAIIEELRDYAEEEKIREPRELKDHLMAQIRAQMMPKDDAYRFEESPCAILVVGVNGVGKTTSIGKLAKFYKDQGKKVLLAAADTFRAGAIDQLAEWAGRAGVELIAQKEGADPAAVVFDAVAAAKARKADVLICDTAGRLHNKKNLMEELKKIRRILAKEYDDSAVESLIVLDGTTGQNALAQVREFAGASQVDGIILTKMDGTAKGGIAVAIEGELGVPVKFIGFGEGIGDLSRFDPEAYVAGLFREEEEK